MTDVAKHTDVWVIQAGDSFRFAFKPLLAGWITGKLRG